MAEGCGEPVEITALRTNLTSITSAVTVGDNLHWFSTCLVQKYFLTHNTAQGILHRRGTTAESRAGELLNCVSNVIRATDEKRKRFNEFVAIFSNDQAYEELVRKLRRRLIRVDSNQPVPPYAHSSPTRDTFSPSSPSSTLTAAQDSGFEQSSPSSSLGPVTGVYSPFRTTSSSPVVSNPFSYPEPSTTFWDLDRVTATKEELENMFATLCVYTELELSAEEAKDSLFLKTFRYRLLLSPVRKSILHVKFFDISENDIREAKSSQEILVIACRYMDYRNYEILNTIVKTCCSITLKEKMKQFCKSLEEFETATTVDVYLNAIADEMDKGVRKGFSEMVVEIGKPATQCTLHEVRQLNKTIIKESSLCSHSVYIGAVYRGSVVVRFIFPSSAVGWVLAAITPEFMASHHITDVTVDGTKLSTIKANINELNENLVTASVSGDVMRAASCLNGGANIETQGKGSATPLHHASQYGHVHVIRLLTSRGADLQSRDKDGWTPLMFSAIRGKCDEVREFTSLGADVNAQDNVGNSALTLAASQGHTGVVLELVKPTTDLRARTDLDLQNNEGDTSLMLAAERGHVRVVEELVRAGAKLDLQNNDGDSAVIRAALEYQPATLGELVRAGSDINLTNKEGLTALMIAAKSERTDITNILQHANKENLHTRKRRQPALHLSDTKKETQPPPKCSRLVLTPTSAGKNKQAVSNKLGLKKNGLNRHLKLADKPVVKATGYT